MKKRLLLMCLWSLGFLLAAAQDSTRVLLVALDGICTEGYKKANTPNLDALMAEGAYCFNTRNVIPSVTLPNWTSMLCGSGPERHGVVSNAWTANNFELQAVQRNRNGYYPSIFQALKESLPEVKTAFYYNWKELVNAFDTTYMDEKIYLANDAYVPNYERAFDFMCENRQVPTFVFLYDVHTDHAGHASEWMSDPYIRSIEEADEQIGKLFDKMKEAGLYESTYIFFVTDHGGVGYGHGGYSQAEMSIPFAIRGKGVRTGEIKEQNFTVNTASTIARIFGIEQPQVWSGQVLESIFAASCPTVIPSDGLEEAVYYTVTNQTTGLALSATEDGALVQTAEVTDAARWCLLKSGDGYVWVNKAFADRALGEREGRPALVEKAAAATWYLCAHPSEKGVYSIAQTPDATRNVLMSGADGTGVDYWVPSAFGHEGMLWSLGSDDHRTALDEQKEQLRQQLETARAFLEKVQTMTDARVLGSYTPEAADAFSRVLDETAALLQQEDATVEQVEQAIAAIDTALVRVKNTEKVGVIEGSTYRICNADPRFGGKTYLYVDDGNKVRWGIIQEERAAYYDWQLTRKGSYYVLYNVGAGKYLGSCAWQESRPESVEVVDEPLTYELDNTGVMDEPRDWTLRSTDAFTAIEPSKSYLACTDDSETNLTDGRIRPYDPKNAAANHDGYWRIILQQEADGRTLLQLKIDEAKSLHALVEERTSDEVAGSYKSGTAAELAAVIETAEKVAAKPDAGDAECSEAIAGLEAAMLRVDEAEKTPIEQGAVYRICNADPRFKGNTYLYVNEDNKVRWGVLRTGKEADFQWMVTKAGDHYLLYNVGKERYLGSSAWDTERPSDLFATETPVEYELDNTKYAADSRDWTLRSVDSYEAQWPAKSYVACSDDTETNIYDGRVRPWDPLDPVGMHDGFWRLVKDATYTGVETDLAEGLSIRVSNRCIEVEGARQVGIWAADGTARAEGQPLEKGVYIVSADRWVRKVLVE